MNDASASAELEIPAEVAELDSRARRVETPCGDGTMVWRVWGEGEPLVLAHGAQGAWPHWLRNIEALAEDRMVIAMDLPGHGESAEPVTHDHRGMADALATGLHQMLGERLPVDLCGFSFGGVCLAYLAAWYPEVARRLVLVDTGGLETPLGVVNVGGIRGLRGEERRAQLKSNLLGLMLHDPDSVDDFSIWQLLTLSRKARVSAPEMVVPDCLQKILPSIRAPIDAIWGEFDIPHPEPEVQKAALELGQPDGQFHTIAGAGHWAMFERPEVFNRVLKDILDQPVRPRS